MDVVVAAAPKIRRAFYNHIAWCRRIVLNLFIYVGIGHGKSHSSNPNATKHVFDWPKHHHHLRPTIVEIPNSWTGTEASAYVLHIITHYSIRSYSVLALIHNRGIRRSSVHDF